MKKIKYLIIVFTVILLVCVVLAIFINKKKKNEERIMVEEPVAILNNKIEKLQDKNKYFVALSCVKNLVKYSQNNNEQAVKAILKDNNINTVKKVINEYSFKNEDDIVLEEIYIAEGYTYYNLYVKGKKSIESNDYFYINLNLDYVNYTYNLEPINNQEYTKKVNSNTLKAEDLEITKNKYNVFENTFISDQDLAIEYFNQYKNKALNSFEYAYKLLDDDYRNKRFGSIDNYKEYIENNRFQIENTIITQYSVENNGDYKEYILVDNYNNYYLITETSIMEYKMQLDNYTIKTKEFIDKYKKASNEKKVATNVEIFIKMLNNKDYKNVYNYLDEGFKNNYFSTVEEFKDYVENNFFDFNNLTNSSIKEKGNIYEYTANFKSGVGVAAQSFNKTFLVQLKEDTNFTISFNVD